MEKLKKGEHGVFVSSHTNKPWTSSPTMSSNFTHIRHIDDDDGRTIADVRYATDAEQEENLANARLIAASPALYDLVLTSMDGLCGAHTVMWQEKRRAVLAKVKGRST